MSTARALSLAATLLVAAGCSGEAPPPGQPAGFGDAVALKTPEDLDPDPHVLETNLVARVANLSILPGTTTPAFTYDGALPGPLLHAAVGDHVIVHFRNELPEPTTVHWHGVRVPASMDGTPGHSQPEVPPGGTFTYDFMLPDAGLFWYHPHVDSAVQVGYGLYGALLVDDPAEPAGLGDQLTLVLSDIGLKDDGSLEDPHSGGDAGTTFGREGNVLLVNGRKDPVIEARAGLRQRWRIVNAAKTRYYQLELAGHAFTRIGSDGGRIEAPEEVSRLLLTPGQRADVLVVPQGAPGSTLSLRWIAYDRGYGTAFARPPEEVLRIHLANEPAAETPPLPSLHRDIAPLDLTAAKPVQISLTQGMDANGKLVMGIDGVPAWDASPLVASVGDTQIWTVKNTVQFDHPFHVHGFFFQALGDDGQPRRPLAWLDTVNVPVDGEARFAIHYDNRPGMWMFHCHILDHADAGMMGMIDLQQ
jgi:FtsP/CotA-like multicopper oxidase with cupredoxin domain